jgi:hypothetical protein
MITGLQIKKANTDHSYQTDNQLLSNRLPLTNY